MPSAFQFLQNPQIFPYETTLSNNPEILNALIDYITKNPDPLIHNQQQCYVYPNRAADILSLGTTYRIVTVKKDRKNKKTNQQESYYPYLDRMFKNLQSQPRLQENLLGYTNKVLISFAKKTPQIYEYIKDNQQMVSLIVKNNQFLRNLKQFWVTFLIQSTMGLYVFLKNLVLRNLMFRIIDENDTENLVVFETLFSIYLQISRKLKSKILPQDQKEELEEICGNFHDQDFITLLMLKISSKKSDKTLYIGKLLNQIINSEKKVFQQISLSYMQAIEQYFQSYEDSSGFLDCMLPDQLQILKMLLNLSEKGLLQSSQIANLLKRLLVYSSIHKRNTILHNMLFKVIKVITNAGKTQIFKQINVIPFLVKNSDVKSCKYAFGSLIFRICQFWQQNQDKLRQLLTQQQKKFVNAQIESRTKKLQNLNLYRQATNKSQLMSQRQSIQQSEQKQPRKTQIKQNQPSQQPKTSTN